MSASTRFSSLEPLESRIAPALLVVGANLLGGENPKTGESSVGGDSVTLVKVLSGSAIAWYDGNSITSVSFGPNTVLDLTGDVGDLVGNLTAGGRLSDSDGIAANGEDGNVLLANNLLGVTTHSLSGHLGDIGNIITGGTISNVTVHGHLNGVYAGDGAFRADSAVLAGGKVHSEVDSDIRVNPLDPNSATGFTFTAATSKLAPGAGITKVNVAIANELQVFAGNGGAGGGGLAANPKGGSISQVHITSAFIIGLPTSTPSYYLRAGDGLASTTGGAGGSISGVLEETSNNNVIFRAGDGGNATDGAGGAGGNIASLDLQSDSSSYEITGGQGGYGAGGGAGGAGGSITQANFSGKKPNSGVILAADFNQDGIEDILVADRNSGGMVISAGQGNGTFKKLVQYHDVPTNADVEIIEGNGDTPTSAVAVDVDGDGDLDVVVAYKNSSSLGIFTNQGGGKFYDPAAKAFSSTSLTLSYSPEKLLTGNFTGSSATDLVVIENDQGHGKVQILDGDGAGSFGAINVYSSFSSVITSSAVAHQGALDTIFVSNAAGKISALKASGDDAKPLKPIADTQQSIAGGVATLDVNTTGTELVALGSSGAAVSVFAVGNDGSLTSLASLDLSGVSGRPISARFVAADGLDEPNSIALLSVAGSGSQFTLYTPTDLDGDATTIDTEYALSRQLSSNSALKNFVPAYTYGAGMVTNYGLAALGGSLSSFTFSSALASTATFALPFSGKAVSLTAGDGGAGDGAGKGGNGGAVFAVNSDATSVLIEAGSGGNSDHGTAGKGGSISNPASFVTLSGSTVVPVLAAEAALQLTSGTGGSVLFDPNAAAGEKGGAGGAGGAITNLTLFLAHNDLELTTGSGGTGRGFAGGAAGNISAIIATTGEGGFDVETGRGGDTTIGNFAGGAGGSVSGLKYSLAVSGEDAASEHTVYISFATGGGGSSKAGTGGAAGNLSRIALKLDGGDRTYEDLTTTPPLNDSGLDSTIAVLFTTGDGGEGATGGAGGNITAVTSKSVFDQVDPTTNEVLVNFVVLTLDAGDGGKGTVGAGGAGGAISLKGAAPIAGLTYYDEHSPLNNELPLYVVSGTGGEGKTKGGAGGAISGLTVQNAKFRETNLLTTTLLLGASINSGDGGKGDVEGGKGGDISGLLVGTQYGALIASAGDGGAGGKGGLGGSVVSSTLATVGGALFIGGGDGGKGVALGGKGGGLSKLSINAPQFDQGGYVALFGGEGGAATASGGFGGEGGSISGITQMKDINSAIDIIEAGNGGAAAQGTGGKGGSVSGIKTVGFIGKPTDGTTKFGAFDDLGNPQGLFSGRGGTGATAGAPGSVTGVVARQIAAISAAYDVTLQTFAIASIVSGVKADVIGYDLDYDPLAQNSEHVFATSGADGVSPAQIKPVDGFILAGSISGITGSAPFQFNS